MNIGKEQNIVDDNRNNFNHVGVFMPESDSGDDSEPTYRAYSDNVDTDVSNTQDEGDAPSPPAPRADRRVPVVPLNNLNMLTSSDSDSCTDAEFLGGQTTDDTSSTSESEETQIWVPVGNRNGSRMSTSTPPLPSLTSSNASDSQQSPINRNTLPRYSPRDMSSSGNNSNVTSPTEPCDDTMGRGRRHSWQGHGHRRLSPKRVSVLRHDPVTGTTEAVLVDNVPNGDSGIGHDITHSTTVHGELFYPDSPSNISLSILKKRDGRWGDVTQYPCDTTLVDSLFIIVSGLYAMLVVVMGCVMPIADIFATKPMPYLFEGFYIYLYSVSIIFLIYAYVYLLQNKTVRLRKKVKRRMNSPESNGSTSSRKRKYSFDVSRTYNTGSFYLRLGAVAFGVGSMIQSGLLFGQFFYSESFSSCSDPVHGVRPLLQLSFTFIQLYFVFLNSKMCIHRYKSLARFGLMHMVATNLCVWVENIVRETLREIETYNFRQRKEGTWISPHVLNNESVPMVQNGSGTSVGVVRCNGNSLMKSVVESSGPYLYPCSVEYSIIFAGILYVMWKNIGRFHMGYDGNDIQDIESKAKAQRINVDCSGSSRGLFIGIFVLVATVITMIIFFVLIGSMSYLDTALKLEHLSEVVIYVLTSIAVILAFHRMQTLRYSIEKQIDLEESLLLIGLVGEFTFGLFSIIAAAMDSQESNGFLVILSSVLGMFQATLQTVFLLHALRKSAGKREHERQKPGREFVTFLLVCNIALWSINTFEVLRSQANPMQLNYYGVVAWNIVNHVSIPLTIFYRFHSTVCLSNIWKNAWRRRYPSG
ncbi:proton channel OtopLc-like [Pecten maximus]|uniref:proton channel OtopLc-like n=1 Tax=Pecten maximus TaxID=6579 RepID=UPI0014584B08|nr:proton channel OtopLc-like [Pecten maximus]